MTTKCWNAFCIAGDCNGTEHVDVTGDTWSQRRGTAYNPATGKYDEYGNTVGPVFTIYERVVQQSSLVTTGGVPMAEATLCDEHLVDPELRGHAECWAKDAEDVALPLEWVDSTGSEVGCVECRILAEAARLDEEAKS